MHKFLIKGEVGFSKDWGSSERAAKFARKMVGSNAVCAIKGRDVLWMCPEDANYFRQLIGEFKITNTVKNVLNHSEESKEAARCLFGAERVFHAKFGEGSVIHGRGTGRVVVKFDKQKKQLAIAENVLKAAL